MKRIEQVLSSMEVAAMVEKGHKELLRDIRRYIGQLGQSKIAPSDFFQESTYKNSQNKTQPCYNITKKGCEFIAHKLTGVKGTAFTARYINRFHEMEEIIENREQPQENQSCTPTQKLYKGQPVAIIQDISRITGFSKGAIRHVINKNCSVFDYKVLKGTELLHFKSENHLQKRLHSLIIIFESGVKKLAKIYEFKPDMLFTASNYKIIPKTFEGEPVLFYEDIMALTGLSCRQIDEYVLTEARKAPLDGICMLTVYGLPKFKQENPHLKKYLEKEKLVSFIKKKGAINLLKGCGCSKRDVKKVMDYYNQNVSIETNTIYNLDYQKLFVQLDTSNRNKVLNTMIQLYDEQMENENKVKSFSKKQNKNMLLSTQ